MIKSEKDLFLTAFGKHLAEMRRNKNLTQVQLAYDSDIDVMTISRIERGILNISITNVYKIALALGVHHKALFDFELPSKTKTSGK